MAANTNSLDVELSSSQYAEIIDASQTGLDITGDISLAAWVKPESLTTNHTVMGKDDFNSNNRSYRFYIDISGNINFQLCSDGGNANAVTKTSVGTVSAGTYFHVVCTSIAATGAWKIYINGALDNSGTGMPSSIFNGTASFALGTAFNGSPASPANFYDGLLDEVVITSDAITLSEVAALYQGYIATDFLDNVKGYWKLNNSYADSSGNGNTLTPVASPVFSSTVPFANYLELGNTLMAMEI